MSKASFMSMRWLRLHLKEIIWATVILFVLSCFIIGYGTSRAARSQEERQKRADAADQRARDREEAVPENLAGKLDLPAVHLSLPTATASVTQIIDVKTIFHSLKNRPEYKRLLGMPPAFRSAFGAQIREGVLEELISQQLIGMYAQINGIKPPVTAQSLVDLDRQKLTPAVFDRKVREAGMTAKEYGDQRLLWETIKQTMQVMARPIPAASATDEFLQKYYEENKIRFKQDDEITLRHMVVSAGEFAGQTPISDEEIKQYFDQHRDEFKSSRRVSVFHMVINPEEPAYLAAIPVEEGEIRRQYTEKVDEFKEPEQVQARHILIKPRNSFEKDLDTFTVTLRRFTLAAGEGKGKYSFEMAINKAKSGISVTLADLTLITTGGSRITPTPESMAGLENPLKLPVTGVPTNTVRGTVAFDLPAGEAPATLEIKDQASVHTFDVAAAHDEEKAFAAAEKIALDLLARLKDKADFAQLAKEYSDDTASAREGGNLGFFARGQMVKPFEEAAFGAAIGEIKGPVKSNFGYHLIKVEARKAERLVTLEEARKKLEDGIRKEQAALKAETDLQIAKEYLEKQTHTFGELARKYSMGSTVTQNGKLPVFFKGELTDDYTPAQKATLAKEIGDNGHIIPEIESAVFQLKEGEVSDVIKTQTFNDKGEPVTRFHLFQVESFLDPVPLSFTETVKGKIQEILEKEARRRLAENKAKEFAAKVTPDTFEKLASETFSATVASFTLPFSVNPGYSNFALTSAVGQVTMDGHTYIGPLHRALVTALKGYSEAGAGPKAQVLGPVESEAGFHFFQIVDYKSNRYTPFAEVKDKIRNMLVQTPTEEEIRKEFEKNRDKLDEPPKRKVRQIVLTSEEKAQEIYAALQKGEMFSLLAKRHSVDGTAAMGGLLGEVAPGQLPANLEEPVWKLSKGQFTAPIQTSYGYVIAMLDEAEKPGVKATLTPEVTNKIKNSLKGKYAEELVESFLTGLRNSATIIRHPEVLAEL
ncbi:MAG: hypothetical protein GX442_02245 [Candidatus Riflebacteria bacterium]|nr:hypothetical protein [Candidatus Riflebacteria bacterium]